MNNGTVSMKVMMAVCAKWDVRFGIQTQYVRMRESARATRRGPEWDEPTEECPATG